MKLLNRTLTPNEIAMFDRHHLVTEKEESWAYTIDFALITLMLFVAPWFATTAGYLVLWLLYILYALQLVMLVGMLRMVLSWTNDLRLIGADRIAVVMTLKNTSIDWPFGPRARPLLIKNIAVVVAGLWCGYHGYYLLSGMVLVASVINQIGIYYQSLVTLAVMDSLSYRNEE